MFPGQNDPFGISLGGTVQNPITPPGIWHEEGLHPPGERQFLVNCGPFSLRPGEIASAKYAILIGFGGTRLQNVSHLYSISDSLDQYYPILNTKNRDMQNNPVARIYPNPNSGSFKIELSEIPNSVQTFDPQGRIVFRSLGLIKDNKINIMSLYKGFYMIKFELSNSILMKKLFIE
jgi:hypothetical protein